MSLRIFCDRALLQNPHFFPSYSIKILESFKTLCQTMHLKAFSCCYCMLWSFAPCTPFPIAWLVRILGIPQLIPPPILTLWRFGFMCLEGLPQHSMLLSRLFLADYWYLSLLLECELWEGMNNVYLQST